MKQSQPSKLKLLACLAGVTALATVARAGQATWNFTTDPTTGTNPIEIVQAGFADGNGTSVYWKDAGGNPGGFLGITWPLGSSTTIALFPDIDQGKIVTAFTFECDLRIGNPQQNERPADGFSINFARKNDPAFEGKSASDFATGGAVETGTQTGLAICFDTWQGNALPDGGDIEGIIVRVDNKTILRQAMPVRNGACADDTSLQTGPRDLPYWQAATDAGTMPDAAFAPESWAGLCWQPLKVELDATAKLTVSYKGRVLLDKFQTTFFPSAGGIILAGRTGGADEHSHFDNIKLTTTSATDSSPPTAPANLKTGTISAGKVTLTWDPATDDSGRVGYNVERDGTVVATLVADPTFTDFGVQGGKTYSYKVQAVDIAGNTSAFTSAVTATTPTEQKVPTAGLLFEAWNNIGGTSVSLLTDDERYINNTPDFRALATALDTRTVYGNDSHENYGGRLSGHLIPKESGSYEFFLRSDDGSELWLSSDDNPANLALIAEELGCCAAFQETGDPRTSAPINLVAGRRYAIQVLWKEGGGGDYAQVAWRKSGDTTAAGSLQPIPGGFLQTQWDPTLGQPVITTPPARFQTVEVGASATLTAEATIGDKPITYQWSFGGADIAGATGPSLTVNNFGPRSIGVYTVTAANSFGSVSASSTLFPKNALFVEAEDVNFGGGNYIKDKPIGLTGSYDGDAYRGLGTEADQGIDYNADGGGGQPYRADTNIDAGKENQHADGIPRGDFSVKVNNVVGWNDAGEWYNYTREFPAAKDYNLIGRLSSGGSPIHIQMDEVTGGANTSNQTLSKLGEFDPGRATPGWDIMEFFPLVDDSGNLAVIKNWGGVKTFRMTMQPGSNQDMDYFMFIPVSTSTGGGGFTSVAKSGNNLVVAFSGGTLEQADSVNGPWTAVPNAASPATIPITGNAKFLRLR